MPVSCAWLGHGGQTPSSSHTTECFHWPHGHRLSGPGTSTCGMMSLWGSDNPEHHGLKSGDGTGVVGVGHLLLTAVWLCDRHIRTLGISPTVKAPAPLFFDMRTPHCGLCGYFRAYKSDTRDLGCHSVTHRLHIHFSRDQTSQSPRHDSS